MASSAAIATIGTIVSSSTDNQVGVYTAPAIVPSTNNRASEHHRRGTADHHYVSDVDEHRHDGYVEHRLSSRSALSSDFPSAQPFRPFSRQPSNVYGDIELGSPTECDLVGQLGERRQPDQLVPVRYLRRSLAASWEFHNNYRPGRLHPLTDTITISYSDHSPTGLYAFAYTGDNRQLSRGAGSFETTAMEILKGVEDVDSFLTGVSTQSQLVGTIRLGLTKRNHYVYLEWRNYY